MSFKELAKLNAHKMSVSHKIAVVRWKEANGQIGADDANKEKVEYIKDASKG